jgi:hypothetical protein
MMARTFKTDLIEVSLRAAISKTIVSHLEKDQVLTTDIFKQLWRDLSSQQRLRDLFANAFNEYQERFNDFIFFRLSTILLETRRQVFELPFKWEKNDLFRQLVQSEGPAIYLAKHSPFSYGLREIIKGGRDTAILVAVVDPERLASRWRRSGIKDHSRISVFPRSAVSLLQLTEAMRADKIVCCYPDFKEDAFSEFAYVSPALFELGARVKAQLWFYRHETDDDGVVTGYLERASNSTVPLKSIQDFIIFLSEHNPLAILRVERPSPT